MRSIWVQFYFWKHRHSIIWIWPMYDMTWLTLLIFCTKPRQASGIIANLQGSHFSCISNKKNGRPICTEMYICTFFCWQKFGEILIYKATPRLIFKDLYKIFVLFHLVVHKKRLERKTTIFQCKIQSFFQLKLNFLFWENK